MGVDLDRSPRRTRDYQRYLVHQLAQAQSRIKVVDIVTGLIICIVGAVAYALTVTMLDQVFVLATATRIVLLGLFATATLAYVTYAVVLPSVRRINLLYAARQVELADPTTKNSLVNWLQLRDREAEIPESLMQVIEARAATDLHRIDLGEAIQTTHILRASYVLAGVVVVFCLFLFTTTKELAPSLKRVLFPLAEIAPPTETKLTQIDPGSTEIAAGDKVTISAYASGKEPASVMLYVTADDGQYWEPIPLAPPVERFGQWQVTLNDRQKSFEYYLVANDFKSGHFFVTVTAAPMITDWGITYRYPAYTGEVARSEPGGDIDALEGTEVEVELTTNVPVKEGSGRLELRLEKERTKVEMAKVAGAENKLRGKFRLTTNGSYEAVFEDLLGRKPQFRPVKNIRVRKDLDPVLGFVEPKEPEIQLPPKGEVIFRLSASDDYGLDRVRLTLQRQPDGRVLREVEYGGENQPLGRSQLLVTPVDLAAFDLKPGDLLIYWAEGQDNKRPVSNVVSTRAELRTIEIVDPPKEPAPGESKEQPGQEQQNEQREQQPGEEQQSGEGEGQKGTGKPQSGQSKEREKGSEPSEAESSGEGGETQSSENQKQQPGDPTKPQPAGKSNSEPGERSTQNEQQTGESKKPDDARDRSEPGSDQKAAEQQTGESESSEDPKDSLSPEDKESLEKLKEYFDKKNKEQQTPKNEGEQTPGPERKEEKPPSGAPDTASSKDSKGETGEEKPETPTDSKDPSTPENAQQEQAQQQDQQQQDQQQQDQQQQDPSQQGEKKPDAETPDGSKQEQEPAPSEEKKSEGAERKPGESPDKSADGKNQQPQSEQEDGKSTEGSAEQGSKEQKSGDQPKDSGQSASEKQAGDPKSPQGQPESKSSEPQSEDGSGQAPDKKSSPQPGEDKPAPGSKEAGKEPPKDQESKKSYKHGDQDSAATQPEQQDNKSSQGEGSEPSEGKSGEGQEGEGETQAPSNDDKAPQKGQGEGQKSSDPKSQDPAEAPKSSNQPGSPSEGEQPGETSDNAEPGKPGEESGEPQSGKPGKGEEASKQQGSEQSKPGKADGAESEGTPEESTGEPSGEGPQKLPKPGETDSQSSAPPPTDGGLDNSGDAPNPEDLKEGSNLVLRKLQDELKNKQIDPELLKDMGWTEEDARKFAERIEDAATPPEKPADPLIGKAREGFGQDSQLRKSATRGAGQLGNDAQQDLFGGRRAAPPPEYRELFEAYTRSLSKTAAPPKEPNGQRSGNQK